MRTSKEIENHLRFIDGLPKGVIAFEIDGMAVKDVAKRILVCMNGTNKTVDIVPNKNSWIPMISNNCFESCFQSNPDKILLPYSFSVYYRTYH